MEKIKRIGAGILGTIMTGASLLAPIAMGADLNDYPQPFVTDGNTNFLMVVGEDAEPSDVVGAINVAVRLGAEPGKEKKVTTGETAQTTVTGGEKEEIALGNSLNSVWGSALDDSDLTGFIDDEVEVNDIDYDVEETLSFTADAMIASSFKDADFGEDMALITKNEEAIKYKYEFGDVLSFSEVSSDEPLEIDFMGEPLKITGLTNDTVELSMAQKETLLEGESMTVGDYTVTLDRVGASAVRVTVTDGTNTQTKVVSGTEGASEVEFGDVGNFKVDVVDGTIFYIEGSSDNSAKLELGEEITKTYDEEDGIVPLGEPENNNDATWVWEIASDGSGNLTSLTAKHNVQADDADEEVVLLGENLVSPNKYFTVDLDSATTEEYTGYTVSFDHDLDLAVEEGASDLDNEKSMVFESNLGEGFDLAGTEAKKVYLIVNNQEDEGTETNVGVYYQDKDNDNYLKEHISITNETSSTVDLGIDLENEDTEINVKMNDIADNSTDGEVDNVFLVDESGNEIALDVGYSSGDPVQLGTSAEDADGTDLSYNSSVDDDYDTKIGGEENNFRTEYGVVVLDPEGNADSDVVELSVPEEQVKVNTVVSGPGTEITTKEGGEVTYKEAVPIADEGIAALDTNGVVESAKNNKNLILVGSPAVNRLTAQALGVDYPTWGSEWTANENMSAKVQIPGEGNAVLNMVNDAFTEGKVALVVAGWSASDTQAACTVLQQYKKDAYGAYNLSNNEFTEGSTTVKVAE